MECPNCGSECNASGDCHACGARDAAAQPARDTWVATEESQGLVLWQWYWPFLLLLYWCLSWSDKDLPGLFILYGMVAMPLATLGAVMGARIVVRLWRAMAERFKFIGAVGRPTAIGGVQVGWRHLRGKITVLETVPSQAHGPMAAVTRFSPEMEEPDEEQRARGVIDYFPVADQRTRFCSTGAFLIEDATGVILARGPVATLFAPIRGMVGEVCVGDGEEIDVIGEVFQPRNAAASPAHIEIRGTEARPMRIAPTGLTYARHRADLGSPLTLLMVPSEIMGWIWFGMIMGLLMMFIRMALSQR